MPDITTKAVLVHLNIQTWNPQKMDKEASMEVAVQKRAYSRATRLYKQLLDSDALKDVRNVINKARTVHMKMTMPWYDNGYRILPTTLFEQYSNNINKLKSELSSRVDTFLQKYDALKDSARARLGDLYNPNDFPSHDEIKAKFSIHAHIIPVPDSEDWRVELNKQAHEMLKKQISQDLQSRQRQALADLWNRIYKQVELVHERFSSDGRLFKSLLDNLEELTDILPKLNITKDKELDQMAKEVRMALCGYDIDELRKDKAKRQEAAKRAKELLSKFPGRK